MVVDPGKLFSDSRDVLRNFAASLLAIIVVISLTANSFLLTKFAKLPRRWQVCEVFYVNVCVWDLVQAIFPTTILVFVHAKNAWTLGEIVCQVNGFMLTMACYIPWLFFLFITANKHCYFMQRSFYDSNYSKKRVALIILSTWLIGTLICASPCLGWGEYNYDPEIALCFLDFKSSIWYGTFLFVFFFFFPLLSILYTNSCLLRELPKQIALELYVVDPEAGGQVSNKVQFKDLRQLRSFCYVFLVHGLCWFPYILMSIVDTLGTKIFYSNGVPFHALFLIVAISAAPLRTLVFILTNPVVKGEQVNRQDKSQVSNV